MNPINSLKRSASESFEESERPNKCSRSAIEEHLSINDLPDEMLDLILSFLSRSGKPVQSPDKLIRPLKSAFNVSKKWYQIASTIKQIWFNKHLSKLSLYGCQTDLETFLCVQDKKLTSLCFDENNKNNTDHLTDEMFSDFDEFPLVKLLKLNEQNIKNIPIYKFPNIEVLIIKKLLHEETSIEVLVPLNHLRKIKLDCSKINRDDFACFIDHTDYLEVIELSSCHFDRYLVEFFCGLDHVIDLTLNGCFLLDEDFTTLLSYFPNLKNLTIIAADIFSSGYVKELVKLSKLERLTLRYFDTPYEVLIPKIVKIKSLAYLEISHSDFFKNEDEELIRKKMPDLEFIVNDCEQIAVWDRDEEGSVEDPEESQDVLEPNEAQDDLYVVYPEEELLEMKDDKQIEEDGFLEDIEVKKFSIDSMELDEEAPVFDWSSEEPKPFSDLAGDFLDWDPLEGGPYLLEDEIDGEEKSFLNPKF